MTHATNSKLSIGYLVPTREAIMSSQPETGPLIALSERSERLGYDSIWVGDSITARPRHEPLTLLTAIAMQTETAKLGTAVLLPVLRHPVVMAHQVATLDRIAEGRLILGVGIAGDTPTVRAEFDAVGVDFERRVGRMNDHLDLCRKLWSGEPVNHRGEFYPTETVMIGPSPHTPGGPPIWIAGSAEASQRRAGARYDGWMPIGHLEILVNGWPVVQDAARQAGRDPASIAGSHYLTISLDEDPERANQKLDAFLANYYHPASPELMRKFQATYAGPRSGLAAWAGEFVDAGADHLILRFTGEHEDHLEQCATLRAELLDR